MAKTYAQFVPVLLIAMTIFLNKKAQEKAELSKNYRMSVKALSYFQ